MYACLQHIPLLQVKHLKLLALRVGTDPSKRGDVLGDLESTYRWLQDRHRDAEGYLLDHHDEALWLNVDDPAIDAWEWHSASQLVFNAEDEDEQHEVRKWLEPFRSLLLVGGVREIKHPARPTVEPSSGEAMLSQLRSVASDLREKAELTDVVFVGSNGDKHPAHRLFLAMASEHFRREFHAFPGRIADNDRADYVYQSTSPNGTLHELVDLLYLSEFWCLSYLFSETQVTLTGKVTEGNYEYCK